MDGAVLQAASRALPSELAADTDTGTLGIYRLKRYWSRVILARQGHPVRVSKREHHLDHLVLHATGIGLEQAASFLGNAPTFEDFEHWIVATTALVFGFAAVCNALALRGKHFGWVALSAVVAMAVAGY